MCSKGNQSQTSQIGSCRHRLPISLKTANSATVGTVQYIQNAHCFTKDATSDRFRLLARNSVIVGSIGYISFDGPCITILGHFPPRPNAIGYWHRQDKSPGREHDREREREKWAFHEKCVCTRSTTTMDGRLHRRTSRTTVFPNSLSPIAVWSLDHIQPISLHGQQDFVHSFERKLCRN